MATSYSDSSPTGAMEALDLDSSASAAGSGIFSGDMKKHDDLKTMLDSSKESHKLEAMKRIIGMIARGRDCSDLFPAVVKNVVSKNMEIKFPLCSSSDSNQIRPEDHKFCLNLFEHHESF